MSFPFFRQRDVMDCGPTSLQMVAKFYGKDVDIIELREYSKINKEGISLFGLSEAAEKIGFKTLAAKINFDQFDKDEILLPCILYWQQKHFVVLPPQDYNSHNKNKKILIADPAVGLVKVDKSNFLKGWCIEENVGIALMLEPTEAFFKKDNTVKKNVSWSTLVFYVKQHRRFFIQLALGILASSLLQLLFPLVTQSIVDVGINTNNLKFIYIILLAQLMLFFSRSSIEFIRSRLLLYVSTRINVSLLTNFWYKLMRLPLSFFDTKLTGDLQQRIEDQHVMERFLTGTSLSTIFSLLNLIVFSIVLLYYSFYVFLIFLVGSFFYFLWVKLFMRKRRDLNYTRFFVSSKERSTVFQLIHGMQEIKLNNSEKFYRWDWEHIQAQLLKLNFKNLTLTQYQQAGALFINEGKNILITFIVAKLVLDGSLTLGAMLAIQYIIGQLNGPIEQIITFLQDIQDTKIALERLNEIYKIKEEEPDNKKFLRQISDDDQGITIKNLSFSYDGDTHVLKNINFHIPENKVTAIVGISGSGKTTLLKILLKFYENYSGDILIGKDTNVQVTENNSRLHNHGVTFTNINLKDISPSYWRGLCGVVMQEGYIFNDSIAMNIAVGEKEPDDKRIEESCKIANILSFIETLPIKFNTKIGTEGNGISQGQKQRILIARSVYKNPKYILFDEATNALDANNEKVIIENLSNFFQGRTVIIVAHRLSTVKNADNIIVLDKGSIVESGKHEELVNFKGYYYNLVKNQLDIGK